MRVIVVVPAYNEGQAIGEVIRRIRACGHERIVVVDDGSSDDTGEQARRAGALVVRHLVNRGVGGAWGTGIEAALRLGADVVVTMDADGQHDPGDIPRLLAPIERGEADVVVGSRMLDARGMPLSRRAANRIGTAITGLLFGVRTTDSQSGMRALSRAAAARMRLTTSGMEVCSEMMAEVARLGLRCVDAPIRVIYTDYSLSKGQSFTTGLRTLAKLLLAVVRRSGR